LHIRKVEFKIVHSLKKNIVHEHFLKNLLTFLTKIIVHVFKKCVI